MQRRCWYLTVILTVSDNMKEPSNFEEITAYLLSLIPKEEIEKREGTLGEFYPEFVGFVDIYYYMSKVIPKDYTIIDFGAGHNPQSYFFTEHKKYIAVNPLSGIKEDDGMFCPPNCEIYRMTTGEFLQKVDCHKDKVFAICNFVPNWHGEDSMGLVRKSFKNCYTFYPE